MNRVQHESLGVLILTGAYQQVCLPYQSTYNTTTDIRQRTAQHFACRLDSSVKITAPFHNAYELSRIRVYLKALLTFDKAWFRHEKQRL